MQVPPLRNSHPQPTSEHACANITHSAQAERNAPCIPTDEPECMFKLPPVRFPADAAAFSCASLCHQDDLELAPAQVARWLRVRMARFSQI